MKPLHLALKLINGEWLNWNCRKGAGLTFRACLHGGGGPQVGMVTHLSGVTRLSI